ncbi:hypothetical protein LTR22_028392, partial [Elasticomyces elasticus]
RCGCGTRRRARRGRSSKGTTMGSALWRSRRTARRWRLGRTTRRCGCGTRRRARRPSASILAKQQQDYVSPMMGAVWTLTLAFSTLTHLLRRLVTFTLHLHQL